MFGDFLVDALNVAVAFVSLSGCFVDCAIEVAPVDGGDFSASPVQTPCHLRLLQQWMPVVRMFLLCE